MMMMHDNNAMGVNQQGYAKPPVPMQMAPVAYTHPGRWATELCACNPADKCLLGYCYCAHACARANHDGSECCYHLLTSTPWMTISVQRANYGIGTYQDCCGDLLEGTCCMPCAIRRSLVEAEMYPLSRTTTAATGVPVLFKGGFFQGVTGYGNYQMGSHSRNMWSAGGLGDCWGGACSHTFCYALLLPQCAASRARQYLDGSDCIFNLISITPCNVYYMTRHYYGIRGTCHEDLCVSFFCYACAIDRVYREILLNTSSEVLSGCCNGCCGGVPRDKGPRVQAMVQERRRRCVCCC
eukprot:TRINITY_DN24131_c0_g1_i1.p1 TRINITY_DN24131_c0_g1~~TRINITY_DN24131_c0_g1_i1.p1  ORF type:complete len:296 (+),score=43.73 TRINITY_DN24131_c0_g1_i1:17-904(+)